MTGIRKAFTAGEFKLDAKGAVTVAFAQLDIVDLDKDVSLPGSFPEGKAVPMSAYGHTSWDGALPIGKGAVREENGWAVFDGQFFMGTDQGRNAYETVKAMGELQEWSYGLNPFDTSYGVKDGQNVRFIKSQDVFEVSPVLKGAGPTTHTMGIKGAPGSDAPYAEHLAWLLDEVKALDDRTRDRVEWRAKEGRVLSNANREMLTRLRETLTERIAELDDLIGMTEAPKAADRRRADIAVAIEMARLAGIRT